jgi:diacylglycerol kinase
MVNHKRLRDSFGNAFKGLYRLLRDEQNARIHVVITMFVFASAIILDISRLEAAILFIAVILVFSMEIINTAIEELIDHLHPHKHETIARIKDGMAGAVFISAIIATAVAFLVFYPHVAALFNR